MFNIDDLIDFRIYKNKKVNLSKDKDKNVNHLIFLTGLSTEENKKMTKANFLYLLNFKSYYISKRVSLKNSSNATKKKYVKQNKEYQEIRAYNSRINVFASSVDKYNNKNLFVDLANEMNFLFNNPNWKGKNKIINLKNQIVNLFTNPIYKNYTHKTVLINMNSSWKIDKESFSSGGSCNNIIELIYKSVYLKLFSLNDKEKLSGINFIVYNESSNSFFKFDIDSLTLKSLNKIKRAVIIFNKINHNEALTDEEKSELLEKDKENTKDEQTKVTTKVMNEIKSTIYKDINKTQYLTGEEKEIVEKIEDLVEDYYKENPDNELKMINELESSEEFSNYMNELENEKITAKRNNMKNNKRLQKIQAEYEALKINNKTISEITRHESEKSINDTNFKFNSVNNVVKSSTLNDFDRSYNEKLKEKDFIGVFDSFKGDNHSIPMYVTNIENEDTSDSFNKQTTYHITMKDVNGKNHNITIDVPNLIDDRYLYLNGSKKMILKQLLFLPVVKINPDTVQVSGDYRKTFLTRYGQKVSPKIERLKKILPTISSRNIKIELGDCLLVNKKYLTSIDYDELAANFSHIIITNNGHTFDFIFNQEKMYLDYSTLLQETSLIPVCIIDNGNEIIGIDDLNDIQYIKSSNKPIIDIKTDNPINYLDFLLSLLLEADPTIEEKLSKSSVGKRFIYTRASVLSRKIPLGILLSYHEGLSSLLKKSSIKYEFSDKRKVLTLSDKNKYNMIQFKDGVLYYEMYPIENSLLLSCFNEIDTKNYNYDEFDKDEVYLDYFFRVYGSMNVSKGFDNFIELFIGPITLDVLKDLEMPTDFTELMLYANKLLADNNYSAENDMSVYRVRSNEIINAHIYELISDAYIQYKSTGKAMSIPRDALKKKLLESPLVENYSTLNPVLEAEKLSTTTYKGLVGLSFGSTEIPLIAGTSFLKDNQQRSL